MGIFRRRKERADGSEADLWDEDYDDEFDDYDDADGYDDFEGADFEDDDAPAGGRHQAAVATARAEVTAVADADEDSGPYDVTEAPDDEMPRLDLGSVRVPVPEGSQLQVEMEPDGPLRAVHLVTSVGQFTISAFAAPRTGELWPEVSQELAKQLRSDGARVVMVDGEWGSELSGSANEVGLRFLGVDGPRWMLRGVVAGPPEHGEHAIALLHDIVRYTVVVRGEEPLPVRSPLPLQLPPELEQARAEQAQG